MPANDLRRRYETELTQCFPSGVAYALVSRMALVVEQDEAPAPPGVGVFGVDGVVAAPEGLAQAIQQFGGLVRIHIGLPLCGVLAG